MKKNRTASAGAGRKRVVKDLAATKSEARGGLGLLLPAVQTVREAAAQPSGASVAMGDGSVRFFKDTVSQ